MTGAAEPALVIRSLLRTSKGARCPRGVTVYGNRRFCDRDGRLTRSFEPHQASVVGVVSTRPGFLSDICRELGGVETAPLAVMGIVPINATAANGGIRPGDRLTSSAVPNTAMRSGKVVPGTIIGKTMEGHGFGEGRIRILVMLSWC